MNKKLKIIFAGTPQFAVPTFEKIYNASFEIVCVLTQPDRKAGRGMKLMPSQVKNVANKLNLPILQPTSLKDRKVFNTLKDLKADILVVVAYGMIIPEEILDLFGIGCFNVHASLLPKWRGAAPIHRAIENGDSKIGVTIMKVVEKLDAGPMISKSSMNLSAQHTTGDMTDRLAIVGGELMLAVLEDIALENNITFTSQVESEASYANKINKNEAKLDLTDNPEKLIRKIKAFNPYPGIVYTFREKLLKIWNATQINITKNNKLKAGNMSVIDQKLILILKDGAIELIEVQLEGAKKINAQDFIERYKIKNGEILN